MNILIRANSSYKIGIGHIMRDLVLASQLQKKNLNSKVYFATEDLKGNINDKIYSEGFEVIKLISNHKEELLKIIELLDIELLVIDCYTIDYKYEKYIKNNSNTKIMSIDDKYEKHCCDILLNHNISAQKKIIKI